MFDFLIFIAKNITQMYKYFHKLIIFRKVQYELMAKVKTGANHFLVFMNCLHAKKIK